MFEDRISYILAGLLAVSITSNLLMKKNFVQNVKELCGLKTVTETQKGSTAVEDEDIEVAKNVKSDEDRRGLISEHLTTTCNDFDDATGLLMTSRSV